MKIKLESADFEKVQRFSTDPILSYQHGYLWVGNDKPGSMACFGTIDGKKLKKLCQRILQDLKNR